MDKPFTKKAEFTLVMRKAFVQFNMFSVLPLLVIVALPFIQGCDVTLKGPSGAFTSPGYPSNYPDNTKCQTTITVDKGKIIILKFSAFDLEKFATCPFDFVEVIEGSRKEKYCGNSIPPAYKSKGNSIVVKFESDSSVNKQGFNASFTTIDAPPPPPPVTVNAPNCGLRQVAQSRVIAGINATQGAWPWQAGLHTSFGTFFCGGSLIAPNWVVTAAHCLEGMKASNLKLRLGDLDREVNEGTEQERLVEKIIIHEKYHVRGSDGGSCVYSQLNNDVGLIKLENPFKLSKYINTICLPAQSKTAPVGHNCFITGWGKIKHPGDTYRHLQQAPLQIVNTTDCQARVDRNIRGSIKVTQQMVCAGKAGTKHSGCQGDSGGPLACLDSVTKKFVLHGDVSWGSGNCDADVTHTVFGRMSEFRSWIDQKLREN